MDVLTEFVRTLRRLRRDESGVAMMLTLAVVLVLYILCSGVYAVGETIREKIEMQNACDAAAYSAAVVQADGLSRMAMVNRALSWTYVQLTDTQMDYITYKFLDLVVRRFDEDAADCKDWADGSITACFAGCDDCGDWFTSPGKGWYCGMTGNIGIDGQGKVSLNDHPTEIEKIRAAVNGADAQSMEDAIDFYKQTIVALNALLPVVNSAMQDSILKTLHLALESNLPYSNNGLADDALRKEYLWWHGDTGSSYSPYPTNDTELVSDNTTVTYYSALYNTEKDERSFLSMSDGAVYPDMFSYFRKSDDEVPGGLDQWFVRSYAGETENHWEKNIHPEVRSIKNIGICRVYKNANREGTAQSLGHPTKHPAYMRAHHTGFPYTRPSCDNTREYNWEQCKSIAIEDSVALYADYGWRSTQHYCVCYRNWRGQPRHRAVINTPFDMLRGRGICRNHYSHQGIRCEGHSRSGYGYDSCFYTPINYLEHVAMVGAKCPFIKLWLTTIAPCYNYARIYGDDLEICKPATYKYYTGEIAKPWVLNTNFFNGAGSIVVGLAKKQRNPWQRLLQTPLRKVQPESETIVRDGIYSAFNATSGSSYLTAFSAARAAYHYHPSQMAQSDPYKVEERGWREYETRYDAVCDNVSVYPTGLAPDVGCVCDVVDENNSHRYARCWNLCETDWDATLLPVRFSCIPASDASGRPYDSYAGNGITWSDAIAGKQNVFQYAAMQIDPSTDPSLRTGWMSFYDVDGTRWSTRDDVTPTVDVGGDFLYMRQPFVVEDVSGAAEDLRGKMWYEAPDWKPRSSNGGWFMEDGNEDAAFRRRIL